MKNNAYVAKNGDTGENRKPYQSNPVKRIYCFHNHQKQNAHTQCFIVVVVVVFLIIQGSPLSTSPYFWSKKYIAFSTIRNCMYKRDMEFRPFYLIVRHFVCNLIYSSPVSHFYTPWKRRFQGVYKCDTGLKWVKNSVITHFKVLIISIADWRMFWWWIETKLCTKSIFIKYLSITAGPYQ